MYWIDQIWLEKLLIYIRLYFAQTYSKDIKQKSTARPMLYEFEATFVSAV